MLLDTMSYSPLPRFNVLSFGMGRGFDVLSIDMGRGFKGFFQT